MLPSRFYMEYIKLQSDIQLKNLIMSLYWPGLFFFFFSVGFVLFLTRLLKSHLFWDKYSMLHGRSCHHFLAVSMFVGNYFKKYRSKIQTRPSDKQFENTLRIITTSSNQTLHSGFSATVSGVPSVHCRPCAFMMRKENHVVFLRYVHVLHEWWQTWTCLMVLRLSKQVLHN